MITPSATAELHIDDTVGTVPRLATEVVSFTDETSETGDLLDLLEPPPWFDVAACKGSGSVMFPEREDSPRAEVAKAICASCEAASQCLTFALAQDDRLVGIWAWTTTAERRMLRRQSQTAA